MEEVVISGPGYDPASTNVPGYTQEQLQSFIDGTNNGPVPDGAQSKANSWHRVTKVVSTSSVDVLLMDYRQPIDLLTADFPSAT